MFQTLVCVFCHKPVDPNKSGNFRKVQGWAETRKGGGVHGLTDRKELSEYACGPCMKLRRMGVHPAQVDLF
jgi:hypothetical protein